MTPVAPWETVGLAGGERSKPAARSRCTRPTEPGRVAARQISQTGQASTTRAGGTIV